MDIDSIQLAKPRRWYVLKGGMDATEALDLLIRVARPLKPERRDLLVQCIRVECTLAEIGSRAEIYVPETSDLRGKGAKESREVFENLKQRFVEERKVTPGEVATLPPKAVSLSEALTVLAHQTSAASRSVPAEGVADEWLFIRPGPVSAAQAQLYFDQLALHATSVKWAAMDLDGGHSFAFWVKDDPRRQSNYAAVENRMSEQGFLKFHPFRAAAWLVFLANDTATPQPPKKLLEKLCEFTELCPQCFKGNRASATGPLLALAVNAEIHRSFYLGELSYEAHDILNPSFQKELRVVAHRLTHSPEAKANLIDEMKLATGYRGYRLELIRHHGLTEAVREQQLEEQRDHLDYKLHLLRISREARPTLLRFQQSHLAVFAEVLRHTPMKYLQESRMHYGYFADASPKPPASSRFQFDEYCTHYLWFETGWNDLGGANPFLKWTQDEPPPRKFWLDPFWARYYPASAGVNSLVFVPEGFSLFPTMHGWNAEEMDEYLRKTLRDFLPDSRKETGLSNNPIYIFDGEPGPDATIELTVLDRAQFVKFSEKLDWFNQHIRALDALMVPPGVFHRMGRSGDALLLAKAMEEEAAAWQKSLMRKVTDARAEVEAGIATQLESLDSVLKEFAELTDKELARAREFNKDHLDLQKDLNLLVQKGAALLDQVRNAKAECVGAEQRIVKGEADLDLKIKELEARRKALEHKIKMELNSLKLARDRLTQLLDDLNS